MERVGAFCNREKGGNRRPGLAVPVLHPEISLRKIPGQRFLPADDPAGPAFQAPAVLHLHLPRFLVPGVEVCGAEINAVALHTLPAFFLIDEDVALLPLPVKVDGNLFVYLHWIRSSETE